jgi:hypothetical protein
VSAATVRSVAAGDCFRHSFLAWRNGITLGHRPAPAEWHSCAAGPGAGGRSVLADGGYAVAGSHDLGGGTRWRVFISHTSELQATTAP